jgi:hypothetical protein
MVKLLTPLLILAFCSTIFSFSNYDKVLLSEVQALSLRSNEFTTSRRSSPIPQLTCEEGTYTRYCQYGPKNMMCKNMGFGDKDIVWECTGYGLTPGYKLTYSDVSCEGYDHPDDPYILKGSCGVLYGVEKDLTYRQQDTFSTPFVPTTETVTETTTTETTDYSYSPYKYSSSYAEYSNTDFNNFMLGFGLVAIFFFVFFAIFYNLLAHTNTYPSTHSTSNTYHNSSPISHTNPIPVYTNPYPYPYTWYYPRTWSVWNRRSSYYDSYDSHAPTVTRTTNTVTRTTTNNANASNSNTSDSNGSTTSTTSGNTRRR